jgi:hypothetical protein
VIEKLAAHFKKDAVIVTAQIDSRAKKAYEDKTAPLFD